MLGTILLKDKQPYRAEASSMIKTLQLKHCGETTLILAKPIYSTFSSALWDYDMDRLTFPTLSLRELSWPSVPLGSP